MGINRTTLLALAVLMMASVAQDPGSPYRARGFLAGPAGPILSRGRRARKGTAMQAGDGELTAST